MTKENSKSFILHKDSLSILDKMTDDQAGKLIKAIYYFQINNKLPEEIDPTVDLLLTTFVNQFTRDQEKYKEKCRKNKENARKRWDAKGCDRIKSDAKDAYSDSDSKKDSDSKLIDTQFEELWSSYKNIVTHKGSKKEALSKFKIALKKETYDNILNGMLNYTKECKKNNTYTKAVSRFLEKELWSDYNSTESNREQHTVDLINKMINATLINRIEVTRSNKAKLYTTKENFLRYRNLENKNNIEESINKELGTNGIEYNF